MVTHMQKGDVTMVTRKRNHRMTCRLNDEEYEKVLIKISKSGLSKQEYILSCILNKIKGALKMKASIMLEII